jgi:L-proline amide hydrolase
MLGLQCALDHPEGLESLIVSNIGASTAEIVREMWQRRLELPAEVLRTLARYEGRQDFENPEMWQAVLQYYARFTRRATPFDLETSIKEFSEVVVPVFADLGPAYQAMWGPFEFICTGPLMEWDVTDRLHEIKTPTLILTGWYDECGLTTHRVMAERIPDNEFVIFGNSSHCVILEKEADAYLGVIKDFIQRVIARNKKMS